MRGTNITGRISFVHFWVHLRLLRFAGHRASPLARFPPSPLSDASRPEMTQQ